MSEHKGPLELGKPYVISKGDYRGTVIRRRGNDDQIVYWLVMSDGCRDTRSEIPAGWTVGAPLVPQTEVDDPIWHVHTHGTGLSCDEIQLADGRLVGACQMPASWVPRTDVDRLREASKLQCETIRRLEAGLAEAKAIAAWLIAEEAQAKSYYKGQMESCHREIAHLHDKIGQHEVDANAIPSLPAVDSPERLRDAADVMQDQGSRWIAEAGGSMTPPDHIAFTADELRDIAGRLEREQAEKAKRDKVIEDVAEAIAAHRWPNRTVLGSGPLATCKNEARALLDRFDITPKRDITSMPAEQFDNLHACLSNQCTLDTLHEGECKA